jgi:predicted PurR-regulated permease PerM
MPPATTEVWLRRFLIALTVLGWAAIAGLGIWLLSLIGHAVFLMVISAIVAFVVYPVVKLLRRFLPQPVAVLLTVLALMLVVGAIVATIGVAIVQQLLLLFHALQAYFQPENLAKQTWLVNLLARFNITPSSLHISGDQVLAALQPVVGGVLGVATHGLGAIIDTLACVTVITYLLFDGARAVNWVRTQTPLHYRARITFLLGTMDRKLGGFLRGQLIIASIMSVLLGTGAYFIGVPYAALFGVIVFICEFIPIAGGYVAGVIGVIFALTNSLTTALIMTGFIILMLGIVEGQVLLPRITGKAVELHPVLTLFALLAGGELFGLPGAIFAPPIAGVLAVLVESYWTTFRRTHPDEFPEGTAELQPVAAAGIAPGVGATLPSTAATVDPPSA